MIEHSCPLFSFESFPDSHRLGREISKRWLALSTSEQEFYYQVAKADAAQFEYMMSKKRKLDNTDEGDKDSDSLVLIE
jgi:hypothetical protein